MLLLLSEEFEFSRSFFMMMMMRDDILRSLSNASGYYSG